MVLKGVWKNKPSVGDGTKRKIKKSEVENLASDSGLKHLFCLNLFPRAVVVPCKIAGVS